MTHPDLRAEYRGHPDLRNEPPFHPVLPNIGIMNREIATLFPTIADWVYGLPEWSNIRGQIYLEFVLGGTK